MSTSSSPASSLSSSTRNAAPDLTPTRKVQALLAQFSDSDSESDQIRQPIVSRKIFQIPVTPADPELSSEDEEEEEELKPRGRLAARLLGERPSSHPSHNTPAKVVQHKATDEDVPVATDTSRRPEQTGDADEDEHSEETITPSSPLFFPSPSATRGPGVSLQSPNGRSTAPKSPSKSAHDGRSKFLALVAKHRKERLEREAAEVVKRAAGVANDSPQRSRRVRGSSPADDSSEGNLSSDNEAAKRIQREARPTRKASKKALEEMNRETQRMNRNMQLAHQARTKKRISKESFLSRFGLANTISAEVHEPVQVHDSTATSSATASDAEEQPHHLDTPLTSPLRETGVDVIKAAEPQVKDITSLYLDGQIAVEMHGGLADGDEVPAFLTSTNLQSLSEKERKLRQYYDHDGTVRSPGSSKIKPSESMVDLNVGRIPTLLHTRSLRVNLAHALATRLKDSDSEGEIEIVKDRGLKRKYAAFETLPKRKAKEMPSHLALRSLAHLVGGEDKKRTMNAAEFQANLRKKARYQALEERKQKIEMLKAKGIVVQTVEERERDQQEVEDLVERARQEAAEIQKREKELAKKDGTYVKDTLDDEDDDSDDNDFEEEVESIHSSESEVEQDEEDVNHEDALIDDQVVEAGSGEESETGQEGGDDNNDSGLEQERVPDWTGQSRLSRKTRVISDDEDEDEPTESKIAQTPKLPFPLRAPQSLPRSARKFIPGLQMSDDLPMDLSQAFAATMAESQTEEPSQLDEQESLDLTADLPSPGLAPVPLLHRFDSIELIGDSQPSASQTQGLNVNLLSQMQTVPESPRGLGIRGTQFTPSQRQAPFDLTQDNGYVLSPFSGDRFDNTPLLNGPHSTLETVILPQDNGDSPIVSRRGRLQRGRVEAPGDEEDEVIQPATTFQIMRRAAKQKNDELEFDKKKSDARNIVDEAAEESEDEYAGLGGASDDSGDDEENEADRQMIDEDTQIGKGDEAKLAGLYADRERERDEKEVSKLLKDITTGALRRKRGVGDDLDLSDEEDAAARRREAKRREFARMRRELLKDEAVGKIAEDKKKEAFLRSIEDREAAEEDEDDLDQAEIVDISQDASQSQNQQVVVQASQEPLETAVSSVKALTTASDASLNRRPAPSRRTNSTTHRKPATLAEIRESVSFLIEEHDSQAAMVDLGLSDSEDEPEAYVDLDRHLRAAEADENEEDDGADLGDFVVDDELATEGDSQASIFKKPELPRQERAPYTERRTKQNEIVDRLSLLRQASSSASSTVSTSGSSKMAFLSSKAGGSFVGVPTLLRRATTNSSLGSMSGRETVSATGVTTSKTERGNAGNEKEFVRKGNTGRRNAVNYQADRKTLREEKMSARAGIVKASKAKKGSGFLGGLFRGNTWD